MVAAIDIAASSSEKQCDPAEMPNFSSAAKMFVKKADQISVKSKNNNPNRLNESILKESDSESDSDIVRTDQVKKSILDTAKVKDIGLLRESIERSEEEQKQGPPSSNSSVKQIDIKLSRKVDDILNDELDSEKKMSLSDALRIESDQFSDSDNSSDSSQSEEFERQQSSAKGVSAMESLADRNINCIQVQEPQ